MQENEKRTITRRHGDGFEQVWGENSNGFGPYASETGFEDIAYSTQAVPRYIEAIALANQRKHENQH